MGKHSMVGVHIIERVKHAVEVQNILTQFGCSIRIRLSLHEADATVCSPNGLIVLEMLDNDEKVAELTSSLNNLEGVEAEKMVFDHP